MNKAFTLDKANGKLLGVCSGIARWAGMDTMVVRLLMVIAALLLGPVTILGYFIAALVANND